MTKYTNSTKSERLVINRVHRTGDEQPSNIILLPTQQAEVNEAVYECTTYTAPLSEKDIENCRALGIDLDDPVPAADPPVNPPGDTPPNPPPSPPAETGSLADGAASEQAPPAVSEVSSEISKDQQEPAPI